MTADTQAGDGDQVVDDGFGNVVVRCGDGCTLHVVRPGRFQCNSDAPACPDRLDVAGVPHATT